MLVKLVNSLKVCSMNNIDLFFNLHSDDPRLVQCYRKADCGDPSRISNQSMSLAYCCGYLAGVATSSADGSCRSCTVSDQELANATSQVQRTLTFATCVLWGRDHIRTFDGYLYEFQGVYVKKNRSESREKRTFSFVVVNIN